MIRKQTLNGEEVTLTNEGLKIGDPVFSISHGTTASGKYVHLEYGFSEACSGWHSDPAIIESFYKDSRDISYIRTNKGYSPEECYFKIVK